jgi:Gas vesicle synthesis protein GvpL/GvpF
MAADAAAPERGCYVYGIVFQDVEPTDDASGVGDPPARVETVRHDGIAALVSEIDLTKPLGEPEDLMAHQELLDASAAEVAVLPLRFGAVLTSKEAVVEELLAPHCEEFTTALRELEGCSQYVVKGRYVEQAVLPEILSENPEAAELADEISKAPDDDATRDVRIQLGEIISNAIAAKREADTRELGRILEPLCVASSVREPTHEQDAVHVALLVERSKQDDLEEAVADLARDWEQRVTVRLLGPMAPYDFTGAPPAEV